ncbi:uncharacterized oxidoreductase [[Candida] railenensis]|uniref:Uncharacterized oxidoreductase n=1 Tax=[Candida] railenensis TaxID=45579 RepID=A0A9P0QU21_9ASCO|nr:uncharacterized oxidoreductase [[Candida] railenensis]
MTKVYFISGANRGIGFNIAKILAQRPDVKVITTARNVEAAKELAELKASTGKVEILQLDVSSEESIDALDAQLKKVAEDGVDVFISNAGISDSYSTVLEAPRKVWTHHYTTNALGPILLFQVLYPYLLKKKTRQISFISTGAASIGAYIPFSSSAYGQSKAALNYSVKEISSELDAEEFTVIALSPGMVTTDMGQDAFKRIADPVVLQSLKDMSITPEVSATSQIEVYDKLTRESNGKFLSFDGTELVW